jgi:hypothetical protein
MLLQSKLDLARGIQLHADEQSAVRFYADGHLKDSGCRADYSWLLAHLGGYAKREEMTYDDLSALARSVGGIISGLRNAFTRINGFHGELYDAPVATAPMHGLHQQTAFEQSAFAAHRIHLGAVRDSLRAAMADRRRRPDSEPLAV